MGLWLELRRVTSLRQHVISVYYDNTYTLVALQR